MNTEDKPLVQPGKVTLTAVYDGDDYSYDSDSQGRCRLATLLNVSHDNDVLVATLVTHFPKLLEPLNPQRGALLEFVANIKVLPLNVNFPAGCADLAGSASAPSHDASFCADSFSRNSSGVSLRNIQKLNSGSFKPRRPYGV